MTVALVASLLRFAFNRLDRGRRRGQNSRQAGPGVLSHREQAVLSWANRKSEFGLPLEQVFQDLKYFPCNFNFNYYAEIGLFNNDACVDQSNPNYI